jgi:hypothetical protein
MRHDTWEAAATLGRKLEPGKGNEKEEVGSIVPVAPYDDGAVDPPPGWLLPMVTDVVQATGHAHPGQASFVRTTRQAAMSLSGAGRVGSNQPVYYVVVHGQFVDQNAKVPAGKPLPSGAVITFTVDCANRSILDFSIGQTAPNIARLGPVQGFGGGI